MGGSRRRRAGERRGAQVQGQGAGAPPPPSARPPPRPGRPAGRPFRPGANLPPGRHPPAQIPSRAHIPEWMAAPPLLPSAPLPRPASTVGPALSTAGGCRFGGLVGQPPATVATGLDVGPVSGLAERWGGGRAVGVEGVAPRGPHGGHRRPVPLPPLLIAASQETQPPLSRWSQSWTSDSRSAVAGAHDPAASIPVAFFPLVSNVFIHHFDRSCINQVAPAAHPWISPRPTRRSTLGSPPSHPRHTRPTPRNGIRPNDGYERDRFGSPALSGRDVA